MLKKIFLPSILLVLIYWFWISPEFKIITAWVSIFLFWMMFLEKWFKAFTWWTLEKILQKGTDKTWKSLIFGFSSATIMQSSSLVSLLAISFISAELITLIQWIWIVFWANIGTTTWAWLIAMYWMKVNISLYAMPMLVFWIILSFQKSKALKWLSSILAWLWFLFLWIHYMKEWFEWFQNSIQLIDFAMQWFVWILAFTWIWILATIVMQSSHATIILVIAALATGQVTYENALALVIGANVGTTITAILWSLTSNINWKRLALSDVLFKSSTWLVFIIFMPFISDFINIISNAIWIWADNFTLKLALFHTLFNVLWLVIVIPFMPHLIRFVTNVFPEKTDNNSNRTIYLNKSVLDFPDTALISITRETKRLYNKSIEIILDWLWLKLEDIKNIKEKDELFKKVKILDTENIEDLYKNNIKNLYAEILDFISNAQSVNSKKYNHHFYKLKEINIKIIENIKIVENLQNNLVKYTKSANNDIKNEYNNIISEIIDIIREIDSLSIISKDADKILLISELEMDIAIKQKNSNKATDVLIRNHLISSYMASSLINDKHFKNEIFQNLIEISKTVFNNKISNDILETESVKSKKNVWWFDNIFWLSDKKIGKVIKKLWNKEEKLKNKLDVEKNNIEIKHINNKIKVIEYTLNKYS